MHKKYLLQLGKTSYKINVSRHLTTPFYMFIFIILLPLSTIQRLYNFIPISTGFSFIFLTMPLFYVIFHTIPSGRFLAFQTCRLRRHASCLETFFLHCRKRSHRTSLQKKRKRVSGTLFLPIIIILPINASILPKLLFCNFK